VELVMSGVLLGQFKNDAGCVVFGLSSK